MLVRDTATAVGRRQLEEQPYHGALSQNRASRGHGFPRDSDFPRIATALERGLRRTARGFRSEAAALERGSGHYPLPRHKCESADAVQTGHLGRGPEMLAIDPQQPAQLPRNGDGGGIPNALVCAWLGNSLAVAAKHYLQVTDDHFKAASTAPRAPDVVQYPVPGILGLVSGGKEQRRETRTNPEEFQIPRGSDDSALQQKAPGGEPTSYQYSLLRTLQTSVQPAVTEFVTFSVGNTRRNRLRTAEPVSHAEMLT